MEIAVKRIGKSPEEIGTVGYFGMGCDGGPCPDILETADGDFIIIGKDITNDVNLNGIAGLAPNERAILIPRITLVSAKKDIPE